MANTLGVYPRVAGGSPIASPTSRWAIASRVTESIIRSTSAPVSRKCSAMVVATSAALIRTSAGWSDVETTTTERASASPRSRSMNSSSSRPRSPTRQITFTDAVVARAIDPRSVDLPTPEPAKIPSRCPRPQGTSASRARTPSSSRSLMRGRSIGEGGEPATARRRPPSMAGPPSIGPSQPVQHPSQERISDRHPKRVAGRLDDRARCDPAHVSERHEERAPVPEPDHLGRHGRAVAPAGDDGQLAHLGAQAGGLDDEADEIRDAAAVAVQVGVVDRAGVGCERALGDGVSHRPAPPPPRCAPRTRAGGRAPSARRCGHRSRPPRCERRSPRGRRGAPRGPPSG